MYIIYTLAWAPAWLWPSAIAHGGLPLGPALFLDILELPEQFEIFSKKNREYLTSTSHIAHVSFSLARHPSFTGGVS